MHGTEVDAAVDAFVAELVEIRPRARPAPARREWTEQRFGSFAPNALRAASQLFFAVFQSSRRTGARRGGGERLECRGGAGQRVQLCDVGSDSFKRARSSLAYFVISLAATETRPFRCDRAVRRLIKTIVSGALLIDDLRCLFTFVFAEATYHAGSVGCTARSCPDTDGESPCPAYASRNCVVDSYRFSVVLPQRPGNRQVPVFGIPGPGSRKTLK